MLLHILVSSHSENKSTPDGLNTLISMLDAMRLSVRRHDEMEFVGAPGGESVESPSDVATGDQGQCTAHVTSQRF